jgi:hypothetical protein
MLSQVNFNTPNIRQQVRPALTKAQPPTESSVSGQSETPAFTGIGTFLTHPLLSFNVLSKLPDEQTKHAYIDVYKSATPQGKADLKFLLDTGKLLSNDADDGSTTLQNLQRIVREPRAHGLNAADILNSALRTLANPYSITQNFGKLSPAVTNVLMQSPEYNKISGAVGLSFGKTSNHGLPIEKSRQHPGLPEEYNVDASGTCVAASMEFDLADKRPAEFARYAADLSSPRLAVLEDFKFSDIDQNPLAAMYWLDQFNVRYESQDFETGKILLAPDQAAIYRAVSQTRSRVPNSRSALDVLMQSTFMQLGSAHSYNTLSDIRTGGFNQSNRGLTEFEKSFAEAIVDDKGGKSSVTYQIVDDNAYLVGYNKAHQETLMDIINSLKSGFNVITGITETDSNGKITGGHEITIVASKLGQDGKLYFICNDTDDDLDTPIEMSAEELIPKIHHAGIPNVILQHSRQPQPPQPPIIQIPPQINSSLNSAAAQQNTLQKMSHQYALPANAPGLNMVA